MDTLPFIWNMDVSWLNTWFNSDLSLLRLEKQFWKCKARYFCFFPFKTFVDHVFPYRKIGSFTYSHRICGTNEDILSFVIKAFIIEIWFGASSCCDVGIRWIKSWLFCNISEDRTVHHVNQSVWAMPSGRGRRGDWQERLPYPWWLTWILVQEWLMREGHLELQLLQKKEKGFPPSSDGKDSTYNEGDLGLIPGLIPGWADPLEEGMATHSSILVWRIPMDRGPWGGYFPWGCKSRTWLSD